MCQVDQIRIARPADASGMLSVLAPFITDSTTNFATQVPSLSAYTRQLTAGLAVYPALVCCQGETITGFAYATRFREQAAYDWAAELTIYLSPAVQGQGLGRRLLTRLLQLLKKQHIAVAYSCLARPNPASEGLHRSLGFRRLGAFPQSGYKGGQWIDIIWYEKRLRPEAPPKAFIPFSEIRSSESEPPDPEPPAAFTEMRPDAQGTEKDRADDAAVDSDVMEGSTNDGSTNG